eukprot:scaffold23930_cov48-Prasinocladus_malaysianus.AAC.1
MPNNNPLESWHRAQSKSTNFKKGKKLPLDKLLNAELPSYLTLVGSNEKDCGPVHASFLTRPSSIVVEAAKYQPSDTWAASTGSSRTEASFYINYEPQATPEQWQTATGTPRPMTSARAAEFRAILT